MSYPTVPSPALLFSQSSGLDPKNLHGALRQNCISAMVNKLTGYSFANVSSLLPTLTFSPNEGTELIIHSHMLAFGHRHTVGLP